MGKSRVVREPINGEVLRSEFKARGVTLFDASAKIGYDESYLSKATRQGLMPRSTMLLKLFSTQDSRKKIFRSCTK